MLKEWMSGESHSVLATHPHPFFERKILKIIKYIWSSIAKVFAKLNNKYDSMEEISKFYTMILLVAIPLVTLGIFSLITDHTGFELLEMIWILFLIVIRYWWVQGNLKKYLVR